MSRVTAVGISEGDLAELIFTHINNCIVWSRLVRVSKRFCQASKKLIKIIYEETSNIIYKRREIKFPDGHSFKKTWHDSGSILSMQHFFNNKLHGRNKWWHVNGNIKWEYNMFKDLKHGVCREWRFDGSLLSERSYYAGLCPGPLLEHLSKIPQIALKPHLVRINLEYPKE